VAFCTQNVVPGIDFTNDPLLQGRNFSYLDTQLKRLGGPNFTHLPINAPKCDVRNFQQDGHMAFTNPKGRVNYEPNSWSGDMRGPRECPTRGFRTFPAEAAGPHLRLRPDSFADHYSQARQFYLSQLEIERRHIEQAFVFELSKVKTPGIRSRMVSQLLNVHPDLARRVAAGLRLEELPAPAHAARPTREDLPPSPALSILANGPKSFRGRKIGVLVSDGVDADLLAALLEAAGEEGAKVEIVAPQVGGVRANDESWVSADEKLDGAPSVLFDAVVLLVSESGAAELLHEPAARDFVSDALAHRKFIGFVPAAVALLAQAVPARSDDAGLVALENEDGCRAFIEACRELRCWAREDAADAPQEPQEASPK
jgi:catalase